jgi:hypothetical protein
VAGHELEQGLLQQGTLARRAVEEALTGVGLV